MKNTISILKNRFASFFKGASSQLHKIKKYIILIAILIFIFGLIHSYQKNPDVLNNIHDYKLLAILLLVTMPLSVLYNAIEFKLTAGLLHKHIKFLKAIEISLISSASNMLPISGGAVVRAISLKNLGSDYKSSTASIFTVALIWLSLSILYSGIWLFIFNETIYSLIFAFISLGVLSVAIFLNLVFKQSKQSFLIIYILRMGAIFIESIRLYGCFLVLNFNISYGQASIISSSSVLGSSVSLVPAGLGIRELFASTLAPLINFSSSAAFLTTTFNRLLELSFLLPAALLVFWISHLLKKKE